MSSVPFLTIDEQPVSLADAIRYLQLGRKFDGFIGEILRQFVLEKEIASRDDLDVGSAVIEQAIIDFRLQRQLTEPQKFQDWLASNGMNYEGFHQQVAMGFRTKQLKETVAGAKLQEYFIERKVYLDRVVLSRIIVDDKELAEELKTQIAEQTATFEQLARDYSVTDDRIVNGMVGPVSRGSMPDLLRVAIDEASQKDVVGPIGMEDRWGLFRIEELLPASLEDDRLKQSLLDELFEQWLAEKMQNLPIKLQVGE
ncbi:MAG: peptidylprolyl isomerase [Cyanobacteria bacterium P01_E01_bin.6]